MKNILFISWDGPQTSYMEGLFLPIFDAIQKKSEFRFHIVQFSWGCSAERIAATQQKANELGIQYTMQSVSRKPTAALGSFYSLYKGIGFLKQYVKKNTISIVMPRSTMPAVMINRLKKDFFLLFDADGLPLEERVDFSGLLRSSWQYRFFKKEEDKMLFASDAVITRSLKSILIHQQTLNKVQSEKFSVVLNGRNPDFFKFNVLERNRLRAELNIAEQTKVFVYCGSLGPQYGWDEMLTVFQDYQKKYNDAVFLVLTGNVSFAQDRLPLHLKKHIVIKKIPFEEVPGYLSIADIAFAIRQPTFSMQGVAPIKLGEYLLMGLPTIASAGIGDSEVLLKEVPNCFLFQHPDADATKKAVAFIENIQMIDKESIREFGLRYFSIEKSAESYLRVLNKL